MGLMHDRTREILEAHLDGDFSIFPMSPRGAALDDLGELGERLGVQFPPEFVAHVTGTFPGVLIEAKEHIWPTPDELAVGPFWTMCKTLHTLSACPESDDWMRLDYRAEVLQSRFGVTAAPILFREGDPNPWCAMPDGSIAWLTTDEIEFHPVETDFWGLLDQQVAELAENKEKVQNYPQDAGDWLSEALYG